jgi:SAM-dependent methyltransferase
MLATAESNVGGAGWAARLVCADGFRLPLRDGSIDAITVAFGVRNLRPRLAALAEMRRVLAPGGTLAVLEACAPRGGAFAPFHRFHLRRVVPWLGRLSPDPSAYLYLRDSIFEFGDGLSFERDLSDTGFTITGQHSFLLGATRIWVAHAPGEPAPSLQIAGSGGTDRGEMPHDARARDREWSVWATTQMATSGILSVAMAYGFIRFLEVAKELPLEGWQRWGMGVLLAGGAVVFAVRTAFFALCRGTPPPRR